MLAQLDSVLEGLSTNSGYSTRIRAATDWRDQVDDFILRPNYPVFLKNTMPIILSILQDQTKDQQDLRNHIFKILHNSSKQPFSEAFSPYAERIIDLLWWHIENDDEDNAAFCIRIISNVIQHKHEALASKVPVFLGRIQDSLQQLERVAIEQLDNTQPLSVADLSPSGRKSLKLLSEYPAVAISIFEAYPRTIHGSLKLLQVINTTLCYQAKTQEQAHEDEAAKGSILVGVSPDIKNKTAFGELIIVQVKTMTLLSYWLRHKARFMDTQQQQKYLPWLANIVVRLLKDCPEETSVRKELLEAIRSIVNFNFRKLFLPVINELLDQGVLIGKGVTAYETLRPLAYSMLADLVSHVYEDMPPNTIFKVVEVYTKILQDNNTIGTAIQTISLRLLRTISKSFPQILEDVNAWYCWMLILDAIRVKFRAMNLRFRDVETLFPKRGLSEQETSKAGPIKTSAFTENPVNDKELLLMMLSVVDEILVLLKSSKITAVDDDNAPVQMADLLSNEEVHRLFRLRRRIPLDLRSSVLKSITDKQPKRGSLLVWENFESKFGNPGTRAFCNAKYDKLWMESGRSLVCDRVYPVLSQGEVIMFDALVQLDAIASMRIENLDLDQCREMCERLELWRKIDQFPSELRLAVKQATDQLVVITGKWLKQGDEDFGALLRLINAIATGKLTEPAHFSSHIEDVICSQSVQFMKKAILQCLDAYASQAASPTKTYLLRSIVRPILAMDANIRTSLVDEGLIESFASMMWRCNPQSLQRPGDHTDLEALQLSATLVKHYPQLLRHACQDIISFGRTYIQQDDAIIKYAAYVLIGYCITLCEPNADLIKQIYFALLESGPGECRAMNVQALVIIAPVMPTWAAALRNVLAASRTTISHTATLLEFVVSQPELGYSSRDQIVTTLINCLYKVAAPWGQRRHLVVEVMCLIWAWEHRSANDGSKSAVPATSRERMVGFLVGTIMQLPHCCNFPSTEVTEKVLPRPDLCERAMALLFNLLQVRYWGVPSGTVSVILKELRSAARRETLFMGPGIYPDFRKEHMDPLSNVFPVLCIMLRSKSGLWDAGDAAEIQEILKLYKDSKRPDIQKLVSAGRKFGLQIDTWMGSGPTTTKTHDAESLVTEDTVDLGKSARENEVCAQFSERCQKAGIYGRIKMFIRALLQPFRKKAKRDTRELWDEEKVPLLA